MAIAGISLFILFVYIGGTIFVVGALIYLIAKRIEDRQKEDFEKREN
mgnify:CR=1 FL=1